MSPFSLLPEELLNTVIDRKKATAIDLVARAARSSPVLTVSGTNGSNRNVEDKPSEADSPDPVHLRLYDLLDRRIRRYGEEYERQTGVHAVWLGYPLIYLSAGATNGPQWLLAPVFLWPVSVKLDTRHAGRILVDRASGTGPPQFNRAMASWVSRYLNVNLQTLAEGELDELDWDRIKEHLGQIANHFNEPPEIDCSGPLEVVPTVESLRDEVHPRYYHASVLGCFHAKDEAILRDLVDLEQHDLKDGVSGQIAGGRMLPAPRGEPPPAEEDRYLVTEADYSQESAVWMARREPGLVLHGPPGTGKSQTIVNIIADALAHGRRVLMVCQKQSATRVVMGRLQAAGLADLCVEVNNPESDRGKIFKGIRDQAKALPPTDPVIDRPRRDLLASEIGELENELDRYARALHGTHPRFGLSYREMKDSEGKVARSLESRNP
jgi:primosomal replication protein N''